MSVIELLTGDPLIMISLGATLVPLFIAVVLMALMAIQNRPRQSRQPDDDLLALADFPDAQRDPALDMMMDGAPLAPPAMPDQAGAVEVKTGSKAPVTILSTQSSEPEKAEEKPEEQNLDSAMQDLLESVFGDEVDTGHFDVLLEGVEPIDIHDLLEAVRLTHEQLTGRRLT